MQHNLLTAIVFGIGVSLTGQLQAAGNCSTMLDDFMNWSKPKGGLYEYFVDVTMTTNVSLPKFASYSTGILDYKKGGFSKFGIIPDSLVGDGTTYFSDRTWNNTPPSCTGICLPDLQPFNPKKKDKFRLSLTKNTDTTKVNVNITLLSWNNAKVSFQAQCDNGHIYGFKADQHGTHLYDLTFKKSSLRIIT
jgi:hypothetical protein